MTIAYAAGLYDFDGLPSFGVNVVVTNFHLLFLVSRKWFNLGSSRSDRFFPRCTGLHFVLGTIVSSCRFFERLFVDFGVVNVGLIRLRVRAVILVAISSGLPI